MERTVSLRERTGPKSVYALVDLNNEVARTAQVASGQRSLYHITMSEKFSPSRYFPLQAAGFEAGLAVLAIALGWLSSQSPWDAITLNGNAIGLGVAAVVPLLSMLFICRQVRWSGVESVWRVIDDVVVPMFRACNLVELLAISLLAGIGEELFFRGLLQTALAEWSGSFLPHTHTAAQAGDWLAVIAVAILFGALHAVNAAYAVLATLMGVYLGWLFLATDNLAVPMIAHGLYDFAALVFILIRIPQPVRDSTDS